MSWVSKILGLDKNPKVLSVVNSVGNVVLHGIEEASPVAQALVTAAETIGKTPPTTPVSIVTDLGMVIAVLDKNLVAQADTAVNGLIDALAAKFNIPAVEVALAKTEVDAELNKVLGTVIAAA